MLFDLADNETDDDASENGENANDVEDGLDDIGDKAVLAGYYK